MEPWDQKESGRPAVDGCASPLRIQKERPFFPTFGDEERLSFFTCELRISSMLSSMSLEIDCLTPLAAYSHTHPIISDRITSFLADLAMQ